MLPQKHAQFCRKDEDGGHRRLEQSDGETQEKKGRIANGARRIVAHIVVQHGKHDGKADVGHHPELCGHLVSDDTGEAPLHKDEELVE